MPSRCLQRAMLLLLFAVLPGCDTDPQPPVQSSELTSPLTAAAATMGLQAEKKGDLQEAEKWHLQAIEYAEKDGYVNEFLHENVHRVQQKLKQKYGENN